MVALIRKKCATLVSVSINMKKPNKKTPVRPLVKSKARPRRGRRLLRRARFLPALIIAGFATFLSLQPHLLASRSGVLAYATNVSAAGLLTSTNAQRSAHGVGTLSSNGLLASAAQAKANDMVNRNYWSHVTPDGQQPWVFITNAGYQYASAGENLAYGFMSSSDTVTGWMNSPSHRANLLSATYTEVGFGIANSPDFVGNGQQTVVVAMYAKPLAAPAPAPTTPAASQPTTPKATASKPVQATPTPLETPPAADPVTEATPETEIIQTVPASEEVEPITAAPAAVSRVQVLGTSTPFLSVTIVLLGGVACVLLWAIHKGFHLRRYFIAGEKFVMNHLHLDLTVVAIVFLATVLLQTTGVIR